MSGGLVPRVDFYSMLSGIGDRLTELDTRGQAQQAAKFWGNQLDGVAAPAVPGAAPVAATPAAGPAKMPSFAGGQQAMAMPTGDAAVNEGKFLAAVKAGGLTNPNALAAVAAYGRHESGFSPGNIAGSWSDPSQSGQPGTSGGAMSWRGDRFANMRRLTAGAADPTIAQAQFFLTENPKLTIALQQAKSPEEANALMANAWRFAGFDQPGGEFAARLGTTRQYLAKLGGGAPAAGGSATAPRTAVAQGGDPDVPVAGARPVGQFVLPGQPTPTEFEPGTTASPALSSGAAPGANTPAPAAARFSPQQVTQLKAMLASGNPTLMAQASAMIQKAQQPAEYGFQVVGDQLYRTDKHGGTATPLGITKPTTFQTVKGSDGNDYTFNPQTGGWTRAIAGKDTGVRDLTAAEKAARGIPAGSFAQMDADGKVTFPGKAATEVRVENNQAKVETAYDVDVSKGNAAYFGETQKAGRDALGQKSTLGVMRKLIENPAFYSGTGGELSTAAKRAFASVGIADADTAAPQELFAKLSKQFILDKAGGSLGGGFSNGDRDFIAGASANPSSTPEGNKLIVEMATRAADRQILVAKMARQYAGRNGGRLDNGFADELAEFSEKNPVYGDLKLPGAPAASGSVARGTGAARPTQAPQGLKPSLPPGITPEDAFDKARAAVAGGRDPAGVRRQLEVWGLDPGAL